MWTRSELKQRGKISFKRNYWKCILISLLLMLLAGSGGRGAGNIGSDISDRVDDTIGFHSSYDEDSAEDDFGTFYYGSGDDILSGLNHGVPTASMILGIVIFVGIFLIIFLAIMAAIFVLDIFIFNPIEVGCRRFYIRNLNEQAIVGNVGYAFDVEYKNITKIMFFRDLYTLLWSLLFVIPGIVKSYEYRMVPYILAENPQMSKEQAFAESRQMMDGQKWDTFVLDLSFLGWEILGGMTAGILTVLYVQPYKDATNAALYEKLRYGIPQQEEETVWENQTQGGEQGEKENRE